MAERFFSSLSVLVHRSQDFSQRRCVLYQTKPTFFIQPRSRNVSYLRSDLSHFHTPALKPSDRRLCTCHRDAPFPRELSVATMRIEPNPRPRPSRISRSILQVAYSRTVVPFIATTTESAALPLQELSNHSSLMRWAVAVSIAVSA
jgi:hypothetical protein